MIEQLERRELLTINVSGNITSNQDWSDTSQIYLVVGTLTVNAGVTLRIMPGVTVQTNYYEYDILINGTLDATGVTFNGSQTDIDVRSGGRLNLKSNSSVAGAEVSYVDGSQGMITDSHFTTAELRLETTVVVVDRNTFSGATPVLANPSVIPFLYDNEFTNPATIRVYGTTTARCVLPARWICRRIAGASWIATV